MKKVYVKYNPYKLETEISIDGKELKKNSNLNENNRRLQEWVEQLPGIVKSQLNKKEFEIIFKGTELDFEDMLYSVEDYNKNHGGKIKLRHEKGKDHENIVKEIYKIFQKIQKGPFQELRELKLKNDFDSVKEGIFEMAVVATMSAGKSTLINALLGKKLMPSQQKACTATITRIKDVDNKIDYSLGAYYENGKPISKEDKVILDVVSKLNDNEKADVFYEKEQKIISKNDKVIFDIIKELNNSEDVFRIEIEGDIPFVTTDGMSLALLDTPGPNSSNNPKHSEIITNMLKEKSNELIIYVLNATQLEVNDDKDCLKTVSESMNKKGKASRDRFLFVINKLDDYKQDDDIEAALNDVKDYLSDNGIENPNIFPLSALIALDIRRLLIGDEESKFEKQDVINKVAKFNELEKYHLEKYSNLPQSIRNKIENDLELSKTRGDVNTQALIHSGIKSLEKMIELYINKYAKTAKIKDLIDTFKEKLKSVKIVEKLKGDLINHEESRKYILKNIEEIEEKISKRQESSEFKKKIEDLKISENIEKDIEDIKISFNIAFEKIINENINKGSIKKEEAISKAKELNDEIKKLEIRIRNEYDNIINNNIVEEAKKLLKEYKLSVNSILDTNTLTEIRLEPFSFLGIDIDKDVLKLIEKSTKTETVEEEEWIENKYKAWWKFWTWGDPEGHYKTHYKDIDVVEYIDFLKTYIGPIYPAFQESHISAKQHASKQEYNIKVYFNKQFEELDKIIKEKLKELKEFTKSNEEIKNKISTVQKNIKWFNDIEESLEKIIEI